MEVFWDQSVQVSLSSNMWDLHFSLALSLNLIWETWGKFPVFIDWAILNRSQQIVQIEAKPITLSGLGREVWFFKSIISQKHQVCCQTEGSLNPMKSQGLVMFSSWACVTAPLATCISFLMFINQQCPCRTNEMGKAVHWSKKR